MSSLSDMILSNDYADLIISYKLPMEALQEDFGPYGVQTVTGNYAILHVERSLLPSNLISALGYATIPRLYTTLNTAALEASGILRVQSQPYLNLKGDGVLMGFIDTGIDYRLDCFQNSDQTSRIVSIWDQTITDGTPPYNLGYGTEYKKEQIDQALSSSDPLSVVPSVDANGHGTFLAGIAAGTENSSADFIGAAPHSSIAVVKLKQAKEYLKDYFLVHPEDVPVYQETDIMMGLRYLFLLSAHMRLPLVICIGVGTTQGDHSGNSPLCDVIDNFSSSSGFYVSAAGGNEAGRAHHYLGNFSSPQQEENVEILVDEQDTGFCVEFWAQSPELYSIGLTSPLGETIPPATVRLGQAMRFSFLLEKTIVDMTYEVVEFRSGGQLIFLRFQNPTPGIWRLKIRNVIYINGIFHLWLPITGFISPGTVFLSPNPYTTLTSPSDADTALTVSAYDTYQNSLFINSSRGYTRTNQIKPDIAAPGVNVYGPVSGNQFSTRTGTSNSAAIAAGAVALLVNWGLNQTVPRVLSPAEVKNYIKRGASRSDDLSYPNREYGFGTLDLYNAFSTFIG
ncbi:MAG: S8 family peptidase [Clostridiales bacterium]|nr:S8 family peptidase [Clostridiales bacterium]